MDTPAETSPTMNKTVRLLSDDRDITPPSELRILRANDDYWLTIGADADRWHPHPVRLAGSGGVMWHKPKLAEAMRLLYEALADDTPAEPFDPDFDPMAACGSWIEHRERLDPAFAALAENDGKEQVERYLANCEADALTVPMEI